MTLSTYARKLGISYKTAWRWFKAGKLAGYQADTGTIIVTDSIGEAIPTHRHQKIAVYTRVSAAENKDNLEGQAKGLTDYCTAKGYRVSVVIKEIGSGVNEARPKLLKVLTDPTLPLIGVEHKDRLTRFGFNYIEQLSATEIRRKTNMISRIWHGWTTPGNADKYEALLKEKIFVGIENRHIRGFRGIQLLRREMGEEVEFITIMTFDSLEAVREFAGEDYEVAVVPEKARKVLSHFDQRSQHYEIRVERRGEG